MFAACAAVGGFEAVRPKSQGSPSTSFVQAAPGVATPSCDHAIAAPVGVQQSVSANASKLLSSASLASVAVLASGQRRSRQLLRYARAAESDDLAGSDKNPAPVAGMVPIARPQKQEPLEGEREMSMPKADVVYEGSKEVSKDGKRPSGQGKDNTYFWKMAQDKRTIDVIVPVPDMVEAKDVVWRLGDVAKDPKRGPTLQVGFRYREDELQSVWNEELLIDGQILNPVNREDCYWIMDEMAGVKTILITITRPSMMRSRHDPIMKRKTLEERIEPQTWDALLFEERIKPEITKRAFMEIALEGKPSGRIELGLYDGLLPETCNNFLSLCTGEYVDAEGNKQKSVMSYKNTFFSACKPEFLLEAGNPGLDCIPIDLTHEELVEFIEQWQEPSKAKDTSKVRKHWVPRWGADLGLGETGNDAGGWARKEKQALDPSELQEVTEALRRLVEKGEGAKLYFFRPEFEQGISCKGDTFKAEGFPVPAMKRGMLSMDRNEEKDTQGSKFFITLKEFPEMDQRWVTFGEITSGLELIDKIEEEYDGPNISQVAIIDCGELEVVDA